MESVGFEGVARIFARDVRERARSCDIDGQGHEQHENGGDAGLDVHAVEEEAVKRFINDIESGQEQQRGFYESGEIFKLAVAVGMAFVRRFIRNAYGEKSDDRGEQVQAGVQGFREDAQAARANDEKIFHRRRTIFLAERNNCGSISVAEGMGFDNRYRSRLARLCCLSGLLGGVLFLVGDMLFYGSWSSGADFHSFRVMAGRPDAELVVGGALGPVAALFSAFGMGIFYLTL